LNFLFVQFSFASLTLRAEESERLDDRINILPVLMAEQDRAYLIARRRQLAEEEKYGHLIPGFKVGETPYYTTWVPPNQLIV
jgi:hypothetical protein